MSGIFSQKSYDDYIVKFIKKQKNITLLVANHLLIKPFCSHVPLQAHKFPRHHCEDQVTVQAKFLLKIPLTKIISQIIAEQTHTH